MMNPLRMHMRHPKKYCPVIQGSVQKYDITGDNIEMNHAIQILLMPVHGQNASRSYFFD